MVYFSEKYGDIIWDDKALVIKLIWKGYLNSEQFRNTYEKFVDSVKEFKATKAFIDNRNFITIKSGDEKWAEEVIIPKAIKAGLRKVASVLPESLVQKQVLMRVKNSTTELETYIASSVEDAMTWLRK